MTNLTPVPWSADMLVNSYTPSDQTAAGVTALHDGGYIITWQSEGEDGSGAGIFLQRFSADNVPLGGALRVNSTTAGDQTSPASAALEGGGFVVTWTSTGQDGDGTSLHAQCYDATGVAVGGEVQINTTTANDQSRASVAGLADGGYVVTWTSFDAQAARYDVRGQIFNPDDSARGSEWVIASGLFSVGRAISDVNAHADGGFLVAYRGNSAGVKVQGYEAGGVAWPSLFSIPSQSYGADEEAFPTAVSFADGSIWVSWVESLEGAGNIGYRLHGQKLDATGAVLSTAAFVNLGVDSAPSEHTLLALEDGGVVVVWSHGRPEHDLFAQRFSSDGALVGTRQTLTDTNTGDEVSGGDAGARGAAVLEDGRMLITWAGDGDGRDVMSRIFVVPDDPTPVAASDDLLAEFTGAATMRYATVAALDDGGYVLTWSQLSSSAFSWDIRARLYAADGTLRTPSFSVNGAETATQIYSSVAVLENGNIVTAWTSSGQDGDLTGIYARVISPEVDVVSGLIAVNQQTALQQEFSSVHALAGGGFLVTWASVGQDGNLYGVFARRFEADGRAVGDEFQVNTTTASSQIYSTVAAYADGRFALIWSSFNQDGDNYGIYMRRFDANDAPLGPEVQINTHTDAAQHHAAVAVLQDGDTVVTWSSFGQDGPGWGIYAQRVDATGALIGSEFRVAEVTQNDQHYASVTALNDGGFVILWSSDDQDGDLRGLFARRYDAAGTALGSEFQINATSTGDQYNDLFYGGTHIDTLANGDLVVTWTADADSQIYSRVFDLPMNHIYGTAESNSLIGARTDDHMYGFAGNDTLLGGRGNDILDGGSGNDVLMGGAGFDTASYATASTEVEAYFIANLTRGGAGFDRFDKIERLIGSAYDDRLAGDARANRIEGGAGDDKINGQDGDNQLFCGSGDDTVRGGADADLIHGGAGRDGLLGLSRDDELRGGDGRDFLYGGQDADHLYGDAGDDELRGNRGEDALFGATGSDDLRGGANGDQLYGGDEQDFLFGGTGRDELHGEAGNDSLTGGSGAGLRDGVSDTFFFRSNSGFDRIKDFEDGLDLINLRNFGFFDFQTQIAPLASAANDGADTKLALGSGTVVYLQNFVLADLDASDFDL